ETYDPEAWGWQEPEGPLEEARLASAEVQAERIQLEVGSNTTIIGADDEARLSGVNLRVDDVDDVILRNLTFSDTHDCFPGWTTTVSTTGTTPAPNFRSTSVESSRCTTDCSTSCGPPTWSRSPGTTSRVGTRPR